jgi:hypothetical protein
MIIIKINSILVLVPKTTIKGGEGKSVIDKFWMDLLLLSALFFFYFILFYFKPDFSS